MINLGDEKETGAAEMIHQLTANRIKLKSIPGQIQDKTRFENPTLGEALFECFGFYKKWTTTYIRKKKILEMLCYFQKNPVCAIETYSVHIRMKFCFC